MTEQTSSPGRRGRRAVTVLTVVLAVTLATAAVVVRTRLGRRAHCASGTLQYEYDPRQPFSLNSYADVRERLCVTSRRDARQIVDVRLRVTVQMAVDRDLPIFEPDSTWAELEITVDGRVTSERCPFPELSRMTPYALRSGQIGDDGVLAKHCRFAVPRGDRVTAALRIHAVEVSGPGGPALSGPLTVRRDGALAACTRGKNTVSCERADL